MFVAKRCGSPVDTHNGVWVKPSVMLYLRYKLTPNKLIGVFVVAVASSPAAVVSTY